MDWFEHSKQLLLPNRANASGLKDVLQAIDSDSGSVDLLGMEGGAIGFVLARTMEKLGRSLLIITPTFTEAESLLADVEFFLGPDSSIDTALFPSFAHLPFGSMPAHPWTMGRRMKALWRMSANERPVIAIAPIQAALFRLMPRTALNSFAELVLEGEEMDRESFLRSMVSGGYMPTALVEEPGDMAIRGGIVDIYGPLHDDPVRLEFFDDFVDSIRLFHVQDQRSVSKLLEAIQLPMNEVILNQANLARGKSGLARLAADPAAILALKQPLTDGQHFGGIESFLPLFYEQTNGLWDYLDKDAMISLIDPAAVERSGQDYLNRLNDHVINLAAHDRPHLDIVDITYSWEEVIGELVGRTALNVRPLNITSTNHAHKNAKVNFGGQRTKDFIGPSKGEESVLSPLVKAIRRLRDIDLIPWLVCRTDGQIKRLTELLDGYGISARFKDVPLSQSEDTEADLWLTKGTVSSGFTLPGLGLVVLTEEEALGQVKVKSKPKIESSPSAAALASHAELAPGDLLVHDEHGIGSFEALVNLVIADRMGDFLLIRYKGDDKLYLPADKLSLIRKYIGPESKKPPLDRLGGTTWATTKSKVRKKLLEIAQELLDLYAMRQVTEGHAFSGRDELFREFETTFGFDETPDQAKAIDDVIKDMQAQKPMDRLVCGDVGYGKTEVAIRAAFKAVMDGRQVVMLVPTTVLAEQHAQTFQERLTPYPIEVASLSRFKTAKEQREVLEGVKSGRIDVVIGTHRLLSKDVKLKTLGLVIVDEEHRFGVGHKEKLKELRKTVDVLALTATPIPRTLQMSLFTIRDLSIINTAPQDRQAITTYLSKFDPAAIQEAIGRELGRNGQVFFVHNRIKDIVKMANFVQKLMPTARVDVAHGQMSERVLEKVMMSFIRGDIDVLVCTTIIESGLDIPAANTIIINNADRLGLAQIYQLRGRVGRSAERAYAYLLIPEETRLSRDARKRLKVMMDFTHLGAGFKIAMHDLQIRGGGNLLGKAQSGQIGAVGYEMYLNLMEQAVAELKGEKAVVKVDPEIHQELEAFVPESYVSEANQRLLLYRRMSGIGSDEALEDLMMEISDRFGPPPQEVMNLADTIRLKLDLSRAGVIRLDADQQTAVLTFGDCPPISPKDLIKLVRSSPKRYQLTPDQRLIITSANPLNEAKRILSRLVPACK